LLESAKVQYAVKTCSKGFGLANFVDAAGAAAVIETLNDVDIGGLSIFIRKHRPPETRQKAPRTRSRGGPGGGGGEKAPRPDRADREPAAPSASLFVGNLPFSTTEDELQELFAGFSVTSAEVRIGRNGQSRGFGIVTCESVEDATRAVGELHETAVGERPMTVRFDRE
jgi:RNA recognition motif-containing protein